MSQTHLGVAAYHATDEEHVRSVLLTLTHKCNLDCIYCYESHKDSSHMDYNTATAIIDKEIARCDSFDFITFDIFGGEPFLEFDLIKKITEYLERYYSDRRYLIFIMTNGTLMHGEVQSWLRQHSDRVVCGLSLDGTKEMHDYNRCNSFDMIDIDFFKELYPYQDVKMTVSPKTLSTLSEGIIFCHQKGLPVSCNLAYGIDWSNSENLAVLKNELSKIIEYYIENPHIEPCSLINSDISLIGYDKIDVEHKQWCGAGISTCAYDIDGQHYPCQMFMPISAGKEKAVQSKSLKFSRSINTEDLDKKCKDCEICEICPSCYGASYIESGNIFHKNDDLCALNKIIISARAYYQAKIWELGRRKELTNIQEQALLRAILKIQEIKIP